MAKLKYLGTTVEIKTEFTKELIADWIWEIFATMQFKIFFLLLVHKQILKYMKLILPVVLYGCETLSLIVREESRSCLRTE